MLDVKNGSLYVKDTEVTCPISSGKTSLRLKYIYKENKQTNKKTKTKKNVAVSIWVFKSYEYTSRKPVFFVYRIPVPVSVSVHDFLVAMTGGI